MNTMRMRLLWLVALFAPASLLAGDQRDSTFLSSYGRGQVDISDLYVFRSPANANNTVFVMTLSSFVGVKSKKTFATGIRYEIRIDSNADASTDFVYSVQFEKPDTNGQQEATLTRSRGLEATDTLAIGLTNSNIPVTGGGSFRAAIFDDPFFFDQAAFDQFFLQAKPGFPRAPGTAKNFYGPDANVLGIVLEVPSVSIAPNSTIIGVWSRTMRRSLQLDRCGRPFISQALIPRTPRNDRSFADDRRVYNRGIPLNDVTRFIEGMNHVLTLPTGPYKRTPADANALANLLLPDQLYFQLGNPNGFGTLIVNGGPVFLGNGRRLSDDVADIMLNVLTNGFTPTDNVGDDNGARITDGSINPSNAMARAIAFPYVGFPNPTPSGPNP